MGSLLIELLKESIELGLLLQDVGAGGASGFFLQGEMHAFMPAVLLGHNGKFPTRLDKLTSSPCCKLPLAASSGSPFSSLFIPDRQFYENLII